MHAAPLTVTEVIRLVHAPPRSPEPQPAKPLRALADEPIVNRRFDGFAEPFAAVGGR